MFINFFYIFSISHENLSTVSGNELLKELKRSFLELPDSFVAPFFWISEDDLTTCDKDEIQHCKIARIGGSKVECKLTLNKRTLRYLF